MNRFQQKRADFYSALERLEESLIEKPTDIIIDGCLHRFEFTFELAWKVIKSYLEYMGVSEKTGSPRETIQNGFKQGLIENGEGWIEMMLSRNALSHLYDEKESRKIYSDIKEKHIKLLKELKEKLNTI
ncbi:MAG: HI0074 family nucleotidyltransferase substrate-binding subunit [Clostridia bacterium]|nr:HI0074 family nucleotidyltransferase substrate-binding subunit [Clostridia bacterium]